MGFKKLMNLRQEHKVALDEIQEEIEFNGGYVSLMSLIDDSIQIFIDYYKDEAVKRYSGGRYKKKN